MRVVARQALLLASKDIRLFFKDRFGFGFAMIFPLMFVFGFSIALSDVGPEDRQLRFAVATEEEQGLSREVIAALTVEGSGVDEWTADDASQAVEDGDLSGFVLFPDVTSLRAYSAVRGRRSTSWFPAMIRRSRLLSKASRRR